jgi:hypothetical protein
MEAGVFVWSDRQIPVGTSLASAIQRGIESSDAVVVLLSNASSQSEWVRREISAAIANDSPHQRKRLLPVLVGDVDKANVPFSLRGRKWLDASREADIKEIVNAILSAIDTPAESTSEEYEWGMRALEAEERELHAEKAYYARIVQRRRSILALFLAVTASAVSVIAVIGVFYFSDTRDPSLLLTLLVAILSGVLGSIGGSYYERRSRK